MLYEQGLDLDTFQNFLSQNSDPNNSRFYDDFFNLATNDERWKSQIRLPGLPTPPTTPDRPTGGGFDSIPTSHSTMIELPSHNFPGTAHVNGVGRYEFENIY